MPASQPQSQPQPAPQPQRQTAVVAPPVQKRPQPVDLTAAATRPRRAGADITYTAFTCEMEACDLKEGECGDCSVAMYGPVEAPSPAADIVLNICSGDYANANGITAKLRAKQRGVLDVDAHEEYGGGQRANILCNAVFNFLVELVRARRVIGILSGQRCSAGALPRLDAQEGMPIQVLSQQHPNGMPGLSASYQKEVHDSALLGFRITSLIRMVTSQGGWFIAECPEVRGDDTRIVSYDPAFSSHSTVMDMHHWQQLQQDTQARRACAAMCALREGYPQKLESIMFSPNLAPTLEQPLRELECVHLPGAHANSFGGERRGKWNVSSSQTWLSEFCDILCDAVLPLTPAGGPNLRLGVDELPQFVSDVLQWRDASYLAAVRNSNPGAYPTQHASMVLSVLHDLEDGMYSLPVPPELAELDVNACFHDGPLSFLSVEDGALVLTPFEPERVRLWDVALVVKSEPVTREKAPQTERELRNCRLQLRWHAEDQKEIDTLFGMDALHEVLDPQDGRLVCPTKFVRAAKTDPISLEELLRSRLVCQGQKHREGKEFFDSSVPTPMWSTSLTLIGECTVAQGIDFQFDCPQFFQQTECDTPTGKLLLIPPPRYQRRENGVRVLWECEKWLQGAKGAGAAARASFNELVTKNDTLRFTISSWDPSLYIHDSSRGKIRFCLHGDDGCGGWSTSQTLIDELIALLNGRYGKYKPVKYGPWAKQLGFPVRRNRAAGTTTITAEPYIQGLAKLVEGDQPWKPKVPFSKEINELEPAAVPEPGTPAAAEMAADIAWMREACGSMIHIGKVRKDAVPGINMCSRYSHRPDKKAVRCVKHLIWYLMSTPDVGLTFGYSPDTVWADLQWSAAPDRDEVFDTMARIMAYWINCDGALKIDDRSLSGILHMFAGACFLGLSFRQHSTAVSAHESECFTASTAAAQAIPFRGIFVELGIFQEVPTPIVVDSRSTLLVARDRAAMKKSLYIMRRVLFMQECVADGDAEFYSCKGKMNLADSFTKAIFEPTPFFLARRYYMGCKGAAVAG